MVKPFLLDVNLMIALAWPSHVHHEAAHRWFAGASPSGWATCPMTQCGFVRVSSNSLAIPEAGTPAQALRVLGGIVALAHHLFWPDDLTVLDALPAERLHGYRQVTDAYLLGLAISKQGKLATLDGRIAVSCPDPDAVTEVLEIVATG